MTSPNLSHYYISKKPLLVSQSFGRLVLAVWSWADWQNFERLVMVFLKYKNGSNLERSLLSTIQSYVTNPSKTKNFLIMLLCVLNELWPYYIFLLLYYHNVYRYLDAQLLHVGGNWHNSHLSYEVEGLSLGQPSYGF